MREPNADFYFLTGFMVGLLFVMGIVGLVLLFLKWG